MEELKPCPFCGGEAHVKEVVSACETLYTVGCSNPECMGYETWLLKPTKEEAIAAWNRRAERTCRNLNPPSCRDFECSECGESSEFTPGFMPNYCPNCGARVIEEGV